MAESDPEQNLPLTPHRAMFEAEVRQAKAELQRPWQALLSSGVMAGMSVGISVLLLGLAVSALDGQLEGLGFRFLVGGIYAIGFTLAVLGRTDLFTEYTTISVFPLLTGNAKLKSVARLWALVYAGNLIGGVLLALVSVSLGPALGLFEMEHMAIFAEHLARHSWWAVLLSGTVAGWLMGMLSWLIAGGRDTTSQVAFIWIIGILIGVLGLHHSITGGIEMITAAMGSPQVTWLEAAYMLWWMTLGNTVGGIIFAIIIREGVRMDGSENAGRDARHGSDDGRKSRRNTER